ncbi:MAG: SDR family oxidoreductase [Firmicutes bacterium]|nr:SDR family oxidoreductase [Bacillota bacterium]
MNQLFDITGKKVIVTGGSRGLGRGMAKGFHDAGCQVVVMGTNEKVHKTAEELSTPDNQVHGVICDFANTGDLERAFNEAVAHLGGDLDVLVNNAGMQIRHPAVEFPLEDWQKVIDVNLTAAFVLMQLAGKIMLPKGYGKIINTASLTTFSGGLYIPAYAASKGAIAQITKTFCNEWAGKGVNVNAIAPGYMDTDNLKGLDEERMRTIMDRLPVGRLGTPEDMVGAAIFLASHASDYVHGHVLLVDGGWMAR